MNDIETPYPSRAIHSRLDTDTLGNLRPIPMRAREENEVQCQERLPVPPASPGPVEAKPLTGDRLIGVGVWYFPSPSDTEMRLPQIRGTPLAATVVAATHDGDVVNVQVLDVLATPHLRHNVRLIQRGIIRGAAFLDGGVCVTRPL